MTNLIVRDQSAVSKAIITELGNSGSVIQTSLTQKLQSPPKDITGIVISSHDFSYDKDLSPESTVDLYAKDVIGLNSLLERAPQYLPKGGKIVLILSMDCTIGTYASKHYNAIHAARKSLIKSHGNTLARHGISIIGVALGWIEDVLETDNDQDSLELKALAASHNPYQRLGKPKEVAELVLSLLTLQTPFLNGHTINFDGGQINSDIVNMREWELLSEA